jgi:PBP1b-binding outer membrane lipoprotein LpoB
MKSTIVLGIGATLLASCSGNRQKAEEKVTQQQKKPNVIFLIADDIGYGDLSCNGSKTIHTPNVEHKEIHEKNYETYRALYEQLKSLMKKTGGKKQ